MKSLKYLLITVFLILIDISYIYAQQSVQGIVFDKNTKQALVGASISVPGTNEGATTSTGGAFSLRTHGKDTLLVSYIGYQALRIILHGESRLNIPLKKSQTVLDQMIVSASRSKSDRKDAPMAISTISSTSIADTKATSLDQLLNQTAGVYMVNLGNEQHTMSIRQPLGFNDYYLYLEDGIPIRPTGDFNHNGLIEINSEATQRIEVIKGPASSIYGSEAVGGAINFITKKPSVTPEASLETEMGTRGYKRVNLDASTTVNDKLGLYAGGYYANRSQAKERHNDFHKYALNMRMDYTFNDKTELTGTWAYIDYYADGKGDLDSAHFYDDNYLKKPISNQRFTNRKVKATRMKLTLDHQWSSNSSTDWTIYYRKNSIGQNPGYRIGRTSDPHLATGEINTNAFHSYGALFQHNQKFDWWNTHWITGFHLDYTPQNYHAAFIWVKRNDKGVYFDYDKTDSMLADYGADLYNTAAYTQFEFNPIEKLRVVLGARYDRLDYHFMNHLTPGATTGPAETKNHFAHFTSKVGATYDFGNGNGMYINYSQGFSPPNISSLYSGHSVPDLKPSTFYNYEIGGWYNLGNKGFAEVAIYRLDGANEVVSVRMQDGTSLKKNAGETRHQGVELSVHYRPLTDLFLQIGGTYADHKYIQFVDGKQDVSGNQMKGAPHWMMNSKITYKPIFFDGFRISLEWQGISQYYTDAENQYTYKGFNIFNARAGYQWKGIEVWANLLNLTNQRYATIVEYKYGSNAYTPGQLIRFQAGIGYHFGK